MAVTLSMTETHIEMMEDDYSSGDESSLGASDNCSRSPLAHPVADGTRGHVYVTTRPEEQHGNQLESLQQDTEDPLNVVDDHAIDRGSANNEDLINNVMEGGSSSAATQGTAVGQGEDGKTKLDGQGTPTWSYREQFKQLYNLPGDSKRTDFLDKLFAFMQQKGTPISRIPIMAKHPLDLYQLFNLVVERGGLLEVIRRKAWREVAKALDLPASITSAAFTLRTQYLKYLYPYECAIEKLSQPQEIRDAIEGNKRDRRISSDMDLSEFTTSPPTTSNRMEGPILIQAAENPAAATGLHHHSLRQGPTAVQVVQPALAGLPPGTLHTGSAYSTGLIIASPTGNIIHTPHMTLGPSGAPIPLVVTQGPIMRPTFEPPRQSTSSSPPTPIGDRGDGLSTPIKRHASPFSLDSRSPPEKRAMSSQTVEQKQSTKSVPFTNITVRPGNPSSSGATGLSITNASESSLLVSIDFNGTMYQGVLFAKPPTGINNSGSNGPMGNREM